VPLSAVPELQEWLEPFIGGKGPRGNVVMVRLGNEAVEQLDLLVEAGLFGSRSEASRFWWERGSSRSKTVREDWAEEHGDSEAAAGIAGYGAGEFAE
jgi:Arc/MetJ-type ribon-helix-helix transcriptional regulator